MKKILSALVCVLSLTAFSAKAQAAVYMHEWKVDYSLGFVADSVSEYGGVSGSGEYKSGGDNMYSTLDFTNDYDPNNPMHPTNIIAGSASGSSGENANILIAPTVPNEPDKSAEFTVSTSTRGRAGYGGVEGLFRADFFFTPPDSSVAIPLSFDFNFELSASMSSDGTEGRTNMLFAQDSLTKNFVYGDFMYSFKLAATDVIYSSNDGHNHPTGSFAFTAYHYERTNNPPAPTPEPATMLLMGVGLAGLGFVARRRQKQA